MPTPNKLLVNGMGNGVIMNIDKMNIDNLIHLSGLTWITPRAFEAVKSSGRNPRRKNARRACGVHAIRMVYREIYNRYGTLCPILSAVVYDLTDGEEV